MGINLASKGYMDVTAATASGDFSSPPPGGYVCSIVNAEFLNSKAGNLMLVLYLDIAEGDFCSFFKNATARARNFDSNKKWHNTGIYRQLIFNSNDRVSPFFKGLLTCIERSNPDFHTNINNFEACHLQGLLCGFIFASEEYLKRDGSIAEHVVIKFPKSVEDIHNGNFIIPDTKKLEKSAATSPADNDIFGGVSVDADDVPF